MVFVTEAMEEGKEGKKKEEEEKRRRGSKCRGEMRKMFGKMERNSKSKKKSRRIASFCSVPIVFVAVAARPFETPFGA